MTPDGRQIYKFGSFILDVGDRRLSRDGVVVPLKPKSFDLLLTLVQSGGKLVTKDELLEKVWGGAAVEESNITVHVSALRKALAKVAEGDDRFIENVPKYGYRFNAQVQEILEPIQNLPETEALENEVGLLNSQPQLVQEQLYLNRKRILVAAGLALISIFAVVGLKWGSPAAPRVRRSVFSQTGMTRLTTSGNNIPAAISPDGKYMAYVIGENGKQSLWLRVLANSSDLQLLPPEDVVYEALTISPDTQMIYYDKIRGSSASIYQLPLLGGVEKKIINGTSGPAVSFSPDGKSFAFVRWNANAGSDDVWIANSDGSGARQVASPKIDSGDTCSPSWSPDGKIIVCAWGAVDNAMGLFGVSIANGEIFQLLTQKWSSIGEAAWLADGSGLVITAKEHPADNYQLWFVSYPGGEPTRITTDANDYRFPSLTSDSSKLTAIRTDRQSNIFASPPNNVNATTQITFGNYDGDNDQGLAWTPDGRIVYASGSNGKFAIWIMDQDGANRRQLTDNVGSDTMPAVTPDGKYIIFVSDRGTGGHMHLWKMEIDGSSPKQLTNGPIEFLPRVSPDGRWIVYHSYTSGNTTLWKIPIDGGEAVFLLDKVLDTYSPVSPDGKSIACVFLDERDGSESWKIAIAPFAGGPPTKIFDVRPSPLLFAPFQWTSDGKNLAYLSRENGVSNVSFLNVKTGVTQQVTTFGSGSAWYFDWSKDGRLAISRGKTTQDVILISDVTSKSN